MAYNNRDMEGFNMARETRNLNRQMYYTDGNTVRKVAVPIEEPKIASPKKTEERKGNRRSYRRQAEGLEMSLTYVCFLFAMVIVIVMSCVKYLQLNAQASENNSKISALHTQLDTLITKNDAMDYEINGYIDVDYIMNTAINELGMVVAGKEQVQFYDSTVGEYMNQLNDIPEE